MITKNEEVHLEQCISSCKNIANEVIVVDSGSTDNTLNIAHKLGAQVIHALWQEDYAYARNIAIENASQPWILFLDADEYLVNDQELIKSIKNAPSHIGGFVLERKDAFFDLSTGKYCEVPVGIIRLFRNQRDIYYEEPVHEIVGPSILRAGMSLEAVISCHIHHKITSHDKTLLNQKQLKYLRMINRSLKEKHSDWLLYQKAKTLWFFSELDEAKRIFVTTTTSEDAFLSAASWNNLGALHAAQNNHEDSIKALTQSLEILENQSQSHFLLGDVHLKMKQYDKALKHFLKVKTRLILSHESGHIPGALYLYKHQKYYRLALCFYHSAPFVSYLLCRLSLWYNPEYVDALLLKAKLLKRKKLSKRAHKHLDQIKQINPEWEAVAI